MQLKELCDVSEVSAASVKFYLREGLLPKGDQIHSTRAEYGQRHVERLKMITGLRSIVGLSLAQIKTLTGLIDDPAVPRLQLLSQTHAMVLGAPTDRLPDHRLLTEVMESLNWPDETSDARNLTNATLHQMETIGLPVSADVVLGYAHAADLVARQDLGSLFSAESRDEAVLIVAVGVRAYSKLLASLVALAQASHSIRRLGGE